MQSPSRVVPGSRPVLASGQVLLRPCKPAQRSGLAPLTRGGGIAEVVEHNADVLPRLLPGSKVIRVRAKCRRLRWGADAYELAPEDAILGILCGEAQLAEDL